MVRLPSTSTCPSRSRLFGALLSALVTVPASDAAGLALERVAAVGPWSTAGALVGFRAAVWFANSTRFRNHNSADIHRFDPGDGSVRFQRHLFSQDVGDPMVADDLLYWPFEDARFSAGRGEYMVTNGEEWSWQEIPGIPAFHNHAMLAHGDGLLAALSEWKGRLARRDARSGRWLQLYVHPTPAGRVSRITSLALLGDSSYAGLTSRSQLAETLLRISGDTLVPVQEWPRGYATGALTAHDGWLYAVVDTGHGSRVWRTDGERVQAVEALDGHVVRGFSSGARGLWATSGAQGRGALLLSTDGTDWDVVYEFHDSVPLSVLEYSGGVFVATSGPGNTGALWADTRGWSAPAVHPPSPIPMPAAGGENGVDSALAALDGILASRWQRFDDYREAIRPHLEVLAASRSARVGAALSRRLQEARGDEILTAIGGNVTATAGDFHRWYLLRTLGLNGHGQVSPDLLAVPWDQPSNPAEKYVHPLPGAAFVAGVLGDRRPQLLARLVSALDDSGQPLWLRGDVTGALHALSGEAYGYDAAGWRGWWARREGMAGVAAGHFHMGSDTDDAAEAPQHPVQVSRYFLDRTEVSNEEFERFVADSGFITDVERNGWGWHWTDRWRQTPGASWRTPRGPGSDINDLQHHPVVQVSWNDARAYCAWAGKRLPTEAEWEYAARGGSPSRRYAWGDDPPRQRGVSRASFGAEACCRADASDGFLYTAPVGHFPRGATDDGVLDLTGNVWEWVRDRFDSSYYTRSPAVDPVNNDSGNRRVIRGGGWGNDAAGLRATLRHSNESDHGLSMVGIRCAR